MKTFGDYLKDFQRYERIIKNEAGSLTFFVEMKTKTTSILSSIDLYCKTRNRKQFIWAGF